jgi:uncharacterized protein
MEVMSRFEILSTLGITAVLLTLFAKAWLYWGQLQLPLVRFDGASLLWGLGLAGAIILLSYGCYGLWPAYRHIAQNWSQVILRPLAWPDLLWIGLLPGLSEELLFRGVMLPGLGYNAMALVISSLCFGLLHATGRSQWPYALWATLVGVMLGLGLMFTDNLAVPIVAHVCCNIGSAIFWKRQRLA